MKTSVLGLLLCLCNLVSNYFIILFTILMQNKLIKYVYLFIVRLKQEKNSCTFSGKTLLLTLFIQFYLIIIISMQLILCSISSLLHVLDYECALDSHNRPVNMSDPNLQQIAERCALLFFPLHIYKKPDVNEYYLVYIYFF